MSGLSVFRRVPQSPPSFLRPIPQNVVEFVVAPFLDGRDCLSLSLTCSEASKMDKMWSHLAQKWKPKAFAYFRNKHPLTESIDECFESKRVITYLVLDYADVPRLGPKMICQMGVHAKLFEDFPPEFLRQLLGSVAAYFQLPKMVPRKQPIVDVFPDLGAELLELSCERAVFIHGLPPSDLDPTAEKLLKKYIQSYERALMPCDLIDNDGNRHAVMRGSKSLGEPTETPQTDQVIAYSATQKIREQTFSTREYRVYYFRRSKDSDLWVRRPKTDYMPLAMSDWGDCTSDAAEIRTGTYRRFTSERLRTATSGTFEFLLRHPRGKYEERSDGPWYARPAIQNSRVYELFSPTQKRVGKEVKIDCKSLPNAVNIDGCIFL